MRRGRQTTEMANERKYIEERSNSGKECRRTRVKEKSAKIGKVSKHHRKMHAEQESLRKGNSW